jgi:hypothetical protein
MPMLSIQVYYFSFTMLGYDMARLTQYYSQSTFACTFAQPNHPGDVAPVLG